MASTNGLCPCRRLIVGPGEVLGDRGYFCCQPDGRWSVSLRVLPGDADFLTGSEACSFVFDCTEY